MSIQLKKERRDIYKECSAILEKATSEKRDLTADEERRYEQLSNRFDAISDQLDQAEEERENHLRNNVRDTNYRPAVNGGHNNNSNMNTDLKDYSLLRAIDQAARGRSDSFENEISNDIAKRTGMAPSGMFVPLAALTSGGASTGSTLVPEEQGAFIDALRPRLAMAQLGATILSGLRGDVALPRQTAASTATWKTETGELDEKTPNFDEVTLSPKRVGAFTTFSKQLLIQTDASVGRIVQNDLLSAIAIAIDAAAINGAGASNEPEGVLNNSDLEVHSLGTDGANPTYSDLIEMIRLLADADGDDGNPMWLTSPKARAYLQGQMFDSGSGLTIFDKARDLGEWVVSTQCPSDLTKGTGEDLSALIYGDWSNVIVGSFGDAVDLVVDPYSKATSGQTRIVVNGLVDIGVRRGERFVAIKDAVTS